VNQIIAGLEHLQEKKMTHGNLNCKNIIVNEAGNLELSNYGNFNQLCMAHAVWNDDGNLSL
jgi:hypothetical protein